MLLPDNIRPELSIYYNGSVVLAELKVIAKQKMFDLYHHVKNRNDISYASFILCLDWLYLIDAAKIDENGWVELCS